MSCVYCHSLWKSLIYDVQKWGKLGRLLVVAVNSAIDGDKAHTQLRETHFCIHSHFKIVTAKAGEVFHHHAVDTARFYISYHALEIRAVES